MKMFMLSMLMMANVSLAADITPAGQVNFQNDSQGCRDAVMALGALSTDQVVLGGYCDADYLGSNIWKNTLAARIALAGSLTTPQVIKLSTYTYQNADGNTCNRAAANINLLSNDKVTFSVTCSSRYLGSNIYLYTLGGSVILQP